MNNTLAGFTMDSKKFKVVTTAKKVTDEIRIPIAAARPKFEDLIKKSLTDEMIDEDLEVLMEISNRAVVFCEKVTNFFSEYFPSYSSDYDNAVSEILDTAMLGYLKSRVSRDFKTQLSHFLAYGVIAATKILTKYDVNQIRNGDNVVWNPWKDGDLSQWIEWGGAPLIFTMARDISKEKMYSVRFMVIRDFLTFNDVTSVHRAGINFENIDSF